MRRGLCAIFAALLFPAAASAHTDAGWQLAFAGRPTARSRRPSAHDGARWHPGLDIGILRSLDVRAAAEGVVTQVGFVRGYEGYGSVVLVQPRRRVLDALRTPVATPRARRRARVAGGAHRSRSGCTGWCTGTHLHFELRHRGIPIDPSPPHRRLNCPAARAVSSVGRAPARQAGGHWFEPSTAHSARSKSGLLREAHGISIRILFDSMPQVADAG